MDFKDIEISNGKSFADLLQEIYSNSKKKSKSIKEILDELPIIEDIATANTVGPVIIGLLREDVKNDENLIKLAALIQKLLSSNKTSEEENFLTEEEKIQIYKNIQDIQKDIKV